MDTMTLERPFSIGASNDFTFAIDRGIPVPPRQHGSGRSARYPFAQMSVGDSFEVSASNYGAGKASGNPNAMATGLHNCARGYAKRHNPAARFTTRKTSPTSVRVWRTA